MILLIEQGYSVSRKYFIYKVGGDQVQRGEVAHMIDRDRLFDAARFLRAFYKGVPNENLTLWIQVDDLHAFRRGAGLNEFI